MDIKSFGKDCYRHIPAIQFCNSILSEHFFLLLAEPLLSTIDALRYSYNYLFLGEEDQVCKIKLKQQMQQQMQIIIRKYYSTWLLLASIGFYNMVKYNERRLKYFTG